MLESGRVDGPGESHQSGVSFDLRLGKKLWVRVQAERDGSSVQDIDH
jgi:hypothetical protein